MIQNWKDHRSDGGYKKRRQREKKQVNLNPELEMKSKVKRRSILWRVRGVSEWDLESNIQ